MSQLNGSGSRASHYDWVDVTREFFESVQDLSLGELLHDAQFGLFEAMSAIEMMDPKMDAGMLCNRGLKKARTFEQAVADGSLAMDDDRGIPSRELVLVIDTTLACLVSWLEGHSLAQTVFTNLYLHHPYAIANRTMKAFAIVTYKLLDVIKDYIQKAMVYEEEDFQGIQYGYHLNPDISEHRTIGMLREVEEEILRKSKLRSSTEELDDVIAVYARVKFLRVLYQTLTMYMQKKDEYQMAECQRMVNTGLDMLIIMQSTVCTDESVVVMGFEPLVNQRLLPPTFPRYTKIKPRAEALQYFEEMLERFKVLSKISTITAFHQALNFFIDFSKGSPCILSRSALQMLYVGSNSAITKTGSSAWKDILKDAARTFIAPPALVYKHLLHNNQQAKMYIDAFFMQCTKPFASLLQLCGHNRARQRDKLSHLLDEFSALQDEGARVDAYLHNISLAANWTRFHLAAFGTWILYHTLRIMIMYLLSGFELELYSVHEYDYIYWYLYEFLYGWLVSTLTRADGFLAEQDMASELMQQQQHQQLHHGKQSGAVVSSATGCMPGGNGAQAAIGGSSKNGIVSGAAGHHQHHHQRNGINGVSGMVGLNTSVVNPALIGGAGTSAGGGANKKHQRRNKKKPRPYCKDIFYYQALQNMCGGYHKALMGFRMEGKIEMPCPPFDNEQVRYEHRFAPFQNLLSPPPVQYKEFREFVATNTFIHSANGADAGYLFTSGYKHFQDARQLLENLQSNDPEILELIRIAKTNFVVLKLLADGHKREPTNHPEFQFGANKHFPIVKIT